MVNTAVLVSGGGSNLQTILDALLFGELTNCELVGVVSSKPDVYALTRAKTANVPSYVIDSSIFPNVASFTEAVIKKLEDLDTELVVLAGYTPEVYLTLIRRFENHIINIQPSLMPAFCEESLSGPAVHQAVLDYGCKVTGATAYLVTKTPHVGPILLQRAVDVLPDDTAATLQRRVMEQAEWEILPKAVELYCEGKITIEDGCVTVNT